MIFHGLTDSAVNIAGETLACGRCGSTARIANGLCVSCMLEPALGGDGNGGESLAAALAEIDVRDADWRAGNYQILGEIGRGGMGVIYRARQRHSRRIVALKRVLSYHADSLETLARFRREAEAAASLDHPNILPIYEVSEGEDGLPFFSMKFAPGGSLVEAGSALRDEPRRSVALMAKVARAVHYAHGQGILHRDLKPGNILLDGRGEPLVSDFGLAKWLDTTSDVTRTLTIFGTPGYIAPEQARGPAAKLTSAADVYSLGAILFVLFTGRPPFLGEHALAVIQQAAEKPAPKLRALVPKVDRDLETICARCLEREPQARYHSAGDLAEDLERWLQGRPTVTRPVLPSTRIWRWSRRNPKLLATAIACLLLGGAAIWMFYQSAPSPSTSTLRKKVLLSPQEAAEQSKFRQALIEYPKSQIEVEKSHNRQVQSRRSIQERLYSGLAVRVGLDAKLLTDKLPKFADTVKRDPDAPVNERASAAYLGRDYTEAERLFLETADEAQKGGSSGTTSVVQALQLAAWSACKADEFTRAREHLREAEKLTDRQRDPREWADVQFTIAAQSVTAQEHADEAEKRLRDVIEVRSTLFGPEHRETLRARFVLGIALLLEGKNEQTQAEHRELLKLNEKLLGPEHPETLFSISDLAVILQQTGDPAGSLAAQRRVWKLRQKVLGREHPDTLKSWAGVMAQLSNVGQYAEAVALGRELVKIEEKVLGPEDAETTYTLFNHAQDLAEVGEYAESEAKLRQVLKIWERLDGVAADKTVSCRIALAETLLVEGKNLEAESEAREVVKINDETRGVERLGGLRDVLGAILDKQGKHEEAEPQFRQALRSNEKARGQESIETLNSCGNLARNLWYQGENSEAEAQLRELIALNEKVMGAKAYLLENNHLSRVSTDLTPLTTRTLLANTLRDQQKYAEAEAQYKEVIQLEEKVLGPEERDTLNACYNYAYQLAQQGKRDEANALAERAAKGAAKVLGANDPNTREYVKFLEILKNDQPITIPYMKFHETFLSGKQT